MSSHRMEVRVRPRWDLPDPADEASREADRALEQDAAPAGTVIYFDLEAPSAEAAVHAAQAMCRRVLANPILENFDIFAAEQEVGASP